MVMFVMWAQESEITLNEPYFGIQKIMRTVCVCLLILQPYPINFKGKAFVVYTGLILSLAT